MKQNLMKRVMKQCSDFYDMDMKWFVANSTLVEPFFDEVASMHKDGLSPELRFTEGAGNWAQYIADVREAISPWHRPDHLSETEAYQVRQGGTISAKDRLLELCELSSILQFNIIESEAEAAGIPARQTTNRYWGISPQGGDSEEDVYAWHYFMDLDRTWATLAAQISSNLTLMKFQPLDMETLFRLRRT